MKTLKAPVFRIVEVREERRAVGTWRSHSVQYFVERQVSGWFGIKRWSRVQVSCQHSDKGQSLARPRLVDRDFTLESAKEYCRVRTEAVLEGGCPVTGRRKLTTIHEIDD